MSTATAEPAIVYAPPARHCRDCTHARIVPRSEFAPLLVRCARGKWTGKPLRPLALVMRSKALYVSGHGCDVFEADGDGEVTP